VLLLVFAVASTAEQVFEPPKLRLPDTAKPLSYVVDISIDPSSERFAGSVSINIALAKAVNLLWLNATELKIEGVRASRGKESFGVQTVPGGENFVGFVFDRSVGPGRLLLTIRYDGSFRVQSSTGLFKEEDRGQPYVYSQFEATDARRAFPCFDEPSYKAPWLLTLHIPAGVTAVANSPVLAESVEAGKKTVRFRKTPPLPSYLVAFAVGPFEIVDAGRWGRKKTPIRIVVPRGHTGEARWAVEMTGPLLERLEGYFGTAFPFEKLDQLAVPKAAGFGAMENAGLILTEAPLLLAAPEADTFFFRRDSALVNAHEMAHQWFGDLVTLSWWDDIWLNESFAEWLARKLIQDWKPEWRTDERFQATSNALKKDMLASARRIRQPIQSTDDILNVFDSITYSKGAAVLGMFENWIGEKRFQTAVRRYLKARRWGTATASDFLAALNAEGDSGAAAALETFLDQSGAPLVTVDLDCSPPQAPRISLSQRRLVSAWAANADRRLWRVPACLSVETGGRTERICRLLAHESEALELTGRPCPDRVVARSGGTGYYRAAYAEGLFAKVLDSPAGSMSGAERAVFVDDTGALAQAGLVPAHAALELIPRFAADHSAYVVLGLVLIADDVRRGLPPDLRPNFTRFLQRYLGERARAIGFEPRPGEDSEARFLRLVELPKLVAADGEDAALRGEARRLADGWITDRNSVDGDVAEIVLAATAEWGDPPFFEACRNAAKKTSDSREREQLLAVLGSFRDPALARAGAQLIATGEFGPMDAQYIAFYCRDNDPCREALWEAFRSDFDGFVRRLPPDVAGYLPSIFQFCSEERRREVEGFLRPRIDKLPGGPRNLDQTVESIGLCAARRAAQSEDIRAFLEKY
jgi:alanyl aminopeptidase